MIRGYLEFGMAVHSILTSHFVLKCYEIVEEMMNSRFSFENSTKVADTWLIC